MTSGKEDTYNNVQFVDEDVDSTEDMKISSSTISDNASRLKVFFCGVGDGEHLLDNVICSSKNQVFVEESPRISPKLKSSSNPKFQASPTSTSSNKSVSSRTTSSRSGNVVSSDDSATFDEIRANARSSLKAKNPPPKDHGHKQGSFASIVSTTSMFHKELHGTYDNYRLHPKFIANIINKMDVSIPPWFRRKNYNEKPTNVFSEPYASNIKVRGRNYCFDQMKIESRSSTMALVGADKFIRSQKTKSDSNYAYHISAREKSFVKRFRANCRNNGVNPPFLLVLNFILPWGNFLMYSQKRDDCDSSVDDPNERAWKLFLSGTTDYRNERLKLISSVNAGPYVVKKLVGSNKPAMIGQKVALSYFGNEEDAGYLEVCIDVCKGSKLAHTITNAVIGHAKQVTVDLAVTIEGFTQENTLPERILCGIRLHHMALKDGTSCTIDDFERSMSSA